MACIVLIRNFIPRVVQGHSARLGKRGSEILLARRFNFFSIDSGLFLAVYTPPP